MNPKNLFRSFLIFALLVGVFFWGWPRLREGVSHGGGGVEEGVARIEPIPQPTPVPEAEGEIAQASSDPAEPLQLVAALPGTPREVEHETVYTRARREREARMAGVPRAGTFADPERRRAAVEAAHAEYLEAEARAEAWSRETGIPRRRDKDDGGTVWLADVDPENGPLWLTTHSSLHAVSMGAAAVALAPHGLTGAGQAAVVLDNGLARTTHEAYGGRVQPLLIPNYYGEGVHHLASGEVMQHATSSVGTIAASGQFRPEAMGMAPGAAVWTDTWSSDRGKMIAMGMADPSETGKVQVSSHSYGPYTGWYGGVFYGGVMPTVNGVRQWDGRRESAWFGSYSNTASNWDAFLVDTPYYLPVASAGNERNIRGVTTAGQSFGIHIVSTRVDSFLYDPEIHPIPHDQVRGGYDTMGGNGFNAAKNVLTVGAALPAVRDGERDLSAALPQPAYSNWGPMDDGRIKPDLVGVVHFTTTLHRNDQDYGSYSGTSAAGPSVAGALLLLIEKYDQLFPGERMRASTIKALAIHAAETLDSVGPNPRNGWGMLNLVSAVEHLDAHGANPDLLHVVEDALTIAQPVVEYEFYWDESSPIRATLSWTDPRSYAIYPDLNVRHSHICNDLDLRIIDPEGNTHYPWKLDPENPAAPATRGDNTVDTVEQVYLPAPPVSGVYTLRVSHKGVLMNSTHAAAVPLDHQHFSLILSGQTDSDFRVEPALAHVAAGDSLELTVRMVGPALPAVTVTAEQLAGDAGFSVASPASLSFTEADWTVPQSVTVSLDSAYSRVDGYAEFRFDTGALGERVVRVYGDDLYPPERVTDLRVEPDVDETRGILRWTTPGDAESEVVAYEIRHAAEVLTAANWDSATLLEGVASPGVPGTPASHLLRNLAAGQAHHFALRSRDAAGNWSELSNPASHVVPDIEWRAYHNLQAEVVNPSGNVTTGFHWEQTLPLLRLADGSPAEGATLRMTHAGATVHTTTLDTVFLPPGTDVHRYFDEILDLDRYYSRMNGSGEMWLHFENLPPGTYDLVFGIYCGQTNPSRFTLEHVLGAKPKSSPGVSHTTPLQAVLFGNTGDVLRWEGLVPDGDSFRVRVDSASGFVFNLPQLLRLQRVSGPAVYGVTAPSHAFEDETLTLSVHAQGGGDVLYQWYQGAAGDESAPVLNGDAASLELSGLAPGVHLFWVKVTDGSGSAASETVTVTVLPEDNTPPEAVTDLTRVTQGSSSVYLRWTAPADIGSWVDHYELRYSTEPITEESFADATPVPAVPAPADPGVQQELLVSGLQPATSYFFALVSIDYAGNVSALSNVVEATTAPLVWTAYHNTEAETANPDNHLVSR